jgi:inorganic pyrophosphatase
MNFKDIPAGKNFPEEINVIIEISLGSDVKYEIDKDLDLIRVDRFLYSSMAFPFNYGFLPGTLAEDGDPIDIILLSEKSISPGILVLAKIIGLLEMEDEKGVDNKVIAVPLKKVDPVFGNFNDIEEIPNHYLDRIRHFFENYKALELGKRVKLEEFKGRDFGKEYVKNRLNLKGR